MSSMTRDPPPGFSNISMEQVIRADKRLFTVMAQEVSGSLKADAAGLLPMNEKLLALMVDPRVTMFLLPLPCGSKAAPAVDDEEKGWGSKLNAPRGSKPNAQCHVLF